MEKFAYTIFCDDIRQEITGKEIFIGVYRGVIGLNGQEQIVLPQFNVLINIVFTPDVIFKKLRFVVELPDTEPLICEEDINNFEELRNNNTFRLTAIARFLSNNIILKAGTKITTYVEVDGERINGDRIRVVKEISPSNDLTMKAKEEE